MLCVENVLLLLLNKGMTAPLSAAHLDNLIGDTHAACGVVPLLIAW